MGGGQRGQRGEQRHTGSVQEPGAQKVMDLFSKEITSICTIKNVGTG